MESVGWKQAGVFRDDGCNMMELVQVLGLEYCLEDYFWATTLFLNLFLCGTNPMQKKWEQRK